MAKDIIYRGIKHTLTIASASYANHCTDCSLKHVCYGNNASEIEDEIECDKNTMYFSN